MSALHIKGEFREVPNVHTSCRYGYGCAFSYFWRIEKNVAAGAGKLMGAIFIGAIGIALLGTAIAFLHSVSQ